MSIQGIFSVNFVHKYLYIVNLIDCNTIYGIKLTKTRGYRYGKNS